MDATRTFSILSERNLRTKILLRKYDMFRPTFETITLRVADWTRWEVNDRFFPELPAGTPKLTLFLNYLENLIFGHCS